MKYPLRSPRVHLIRDDGELRITIDGLTKGYARHGLPGEGGGWFWRRLKPEDFGHTMTKQWAVRFVLGVDRDAPMRGLRIRETHEAPGR